MTKESRSQVVEAVEELVGGLAVQGLPHEERQLVRVLARSRDTNGALWQQPHPQHHNHRFTVNHSSQSLNEIEEHKHHHQNYELM